jgi:hypothetical protein
MIINKITNEVLKTGEDTSKKATINQDKIAKLQYILTKGLYQDPIGSVINEWSANAIDSVVQSGKNPIENPVIINITDDKFTVQDFGLGISKDDFTNICMNYLSSTKETDNQSIGHFGLGLKSFLALDRSATFTIRKDGIECKFIAYMGDEFMEYDLIYEKTTEEQNGFICELKINNWAELREFKEKAIKRLAYYDTVLLYIDTYLHTNNILRSDDWQYSPNASSKLHLCLKDVYYEINFEQLGIEQINIPIALRFGLEDGLTPTPSRESLILNQSSKEIILNKIKKVANWFIDRYNSEWKEYETLKDAWNFINQYNFYFYINGTQFKINDLEKYADNKIKTTKVKNIENVKWYSDSKQWLLTNYRVEAENTQWRYSVYWSWINKTPSKNIVEKMLNNDYKIVVVDSEPKRRVKSYLQDKYSSTLFVTKICDRALGKDTPTNSTTYFYTLSLDQVPQHEWKNKIKELNYVENQLKENFIYELDVENSQGFKDWLETQKKERVYQGSDSNHKVLNKQEDEVTIAFGRERSIGKGVTFEKETYKINNLNQKPYLTIYFEDKERATQYYELIGKKYKIALIGKREKSKIKNIHNFMTEQQFQKSKVFKRIVTSIMFDELIETYRSIYSRSSLDIIQNLISPLEEDIKILQNYTSKNGKTIRDNELLDSMIAIAKEYNLYDYQFMDVYNRCKESLDKYKFLNYIQKPDRWNEENVKEVNSIITQFLYHQKMYKGLHQELEFVVKEQEIVEELEIAE